MFVRCDNTTPFGRYQWRMLYRRLPGADYGYAAQAANVAAFIRHVSDKPVVLLGHSMGARVANRHDVAGLQTHRRPPAHRRCGGKLQRQDGDA